MEEKKKKLEGKQFYLKKKNFGLCYSQAYESTITSKSSKIRVDGIQKIRLDLPFIDL